MKYIQLSAVMRSLPGLLLYPVLVVALVPTAVADTWTQVPRDSELAFVATYEGEPLPGRFNRFVTALDLSGEPTHLRVKVDMTSLDFDSDDLLEGAVAPEWFYVSRFPDATFESDDIAVASPGCYRASGQLVIKGIRRPVVVPFCLDASRRTLRLTGELSLDRRHFDVGTGEWRQGDVIGVSVSVRFDVLLEPAS